MKIRIHVTQKDIREGECMQPSRCAVARAINRKLKTNLIASVAGMVKIRDINNHRLVCALWLPDSMVKFVSRFDAKEDNPDKVSDLKPTNFTLDIPSMYLKQEESDVPSTNVG